MKLCPNFENRQQKRLCQFENFHGSLKLVIAKYEQLFCAENCIKSTKRNYDMFVWIIRNYEKCLTLVLWPGEVWMYKYLQFTVKHSPDIQWPYGLMVMCVCVSPLLRMSYSCCWWTSCCQGRNHLQFILGLVKVIFIQETRISEIIMDKKYVLNDRSHNSPRLKTCQ